MTDRIPWPVDMRGWALVGVTSSTDKGWRAGLEIWAKGNQRSLIEPDGPIVFSYEVKENLPDCNYCGGNSPISTADECTFCRCKIPQGEGRPWTEDDARALAYHGEDD